jgi:hypothetical protein
MLLTDGSVIDLDKTSADDLSFSALNCVDDSDCEGDPNRSLVCNTDINECVCLSDANCTTGETCNTSSGTCESSCTPDCTDKACGSDGCGGTCGSCDLPEICSPNGICIMEDECTNNTECDDQNQCTDNICETAIDPNVCVYEQKDDGTVCDSGNGFCQSGTCVPGNDNQTETQLRIKLKGVGNGDNDNSNPVRQEITAKVRIRELETGGSLVFNGELNFDYDSASGTFLSRAEYFDDIEKGHHYDIFLTGSNHKVEVFYGLVLDEEIDLTSTEIVPGDLPYRYDSATANFNYNANGQDGGAGRNDLRCINYLLTKTSYSENDLLLGDVNLDGTINAFDRSLVRGGVIWNEEE